MKVTRNIDTGDEKQTIRTISTKPKEHFEGRWKSGRLYPLYSVVVNNGTTFISQNAKMKEEPYVIYDADKKEFKAPDGWLIKEMSADSRVTALGGGGEGGVTPEEVEEMIKDKVDKVDGKGLSTNDYDNTEKNKVASAYQKPNSGIPKSDLAKAVQDVLDDADGAYKKPVTGIPFTDLADGVQDSLSNADEAKAGLAGKQDTISDLSAIRSGAAAGATSVQPAEFNELKDEVDTIGNGAYEEAWDGDSTPVVADIPAGVVVTYGGASYTGTLAASASTVDKIYLVSDGNVNYDRYVTIENSGTYSWKKVGTTAIPLSDYATKTEVSQLEAKVGNVGTELTFNPSALLSNEGFITRTNGKFSAAANYYATEYIDISSVAGQTCKMKSTIYGYAALAFYTATDESAYISDWNVNNIGSYGYATNVQQPVERELPVPATAKYARMSVYKEYYTSLNDLYIKGISTVADELSALKDTVADLEDLPDDVTALETAQGDLTQLKTDVKASLVGAINSLVPEGMQSVTGTMTGIYNYIQILTDAEAYERVKVVVNSLSETPNAIQLYGKNGSTYQLIQAFPNFSGIEVQLLNSYEYVYVLVVYNPSKTFDYNISYSIEPEGNVLTGKKVLIIGDSISTDSLSAQYFSDNRSTYPEYGNYSSYGNYEKWVYDLVMARYFPRNVENNSVLGTGFVRRLSTYENDFVSRIKKVTTPSSYDLVVVFGGINDYISNIPLGESGGDVETYFKPAVDEFFAYLSANFINARIVVLTPLRTSNIYPNTTGAYQQQYSEYIKTVSENYAIPVFDLTKGSGFMPFVPAFGAAWTFHGEGDIYPSGDGVHPSQTYEEQFLAPQIRRFLEMQI